MFANKEESVPDSPMIQSRGCCKHNIDSNSSAEIGLGLSTRLHPPLSGLHKLLIFLAHSRMAYQKAVMK